MSVTSHKSVDGARSYKRSQFKEISQDAQEGPDSSMCKDENENPSPK